MLLSQFSAMKHRALKQFLLSVAADPDLQSRCKAAKDLAGLMQLAKATGFAITARDLQLWAHDKSFDAPWWPWAEGNRMQRMAFFRDSA
jgi:predicted ribosomally synthesized peptide with nif11-like leader